MGSRLDFLNLIYGLFCDCFVSRFVSVSLPELVLLQSFLRSRRQFLVITVCFLPTLKIVMLPNSPVSFSFHTKDKLSKQGTAKSKKNDKNARGEIYHGMMIDFLPDKLLLNHHLPSLRNLTFRFVNKHSARLTAFSITQVSRFVLHRKPSALQKSSREKKGQKI